VHVRVVRFTGVDPARMDEMKSRISESDGPPEGVTAKGVQVYVDRDQRTAVVLQLFESAEDMASSEQAFDSMDPSDTPGTRESVDRCELLVEMGG
jgi:hypothetical protein